MPEIIARDAELRTFGRILREDEAAFCSSVSVADVLARHI